MRRLGLVLIAIFLLIVAYQAFSYQLTTGEDRVSPYKILYEELLEKYNKLKREHEALQEELGGLQERYEALQSQYDELRGEYEELAREYEWLEGNYTQVKYERDYWKKRYEAFRSEFDRIVQEINRRALAGPEACSFLRARIETLDVSYIIGARYFRNFTWVNDVERVYDWIRDQDHVKRIKDAPFPYISEVHGNLTISWVRDEAQFPQETLDRGGGDCEDLAILAAVMLREYFRVPKAGDVYVISIYSPITHEGHAACLIVVPGEGATAIVDPATDFFGVGAWNATIASWFEHCAQKKINIVKPRVTRVVGVDEYREFANNEEFFEWLREKLYD